MNNANPLAKQVMQMCEELAAISQADYVDRRYLTAEHKQANEKVCQWMQNAGMNTWQDSAGNAWGRYASTQTNAPRFLLGSHLDTVPNGGKYDGMLGVVTPIALMQHFHACKRTFPFHIDIVGFGDEEGARFGTTLLGSRALTGKWCSTWATLADSKGISLAQALQDFGLDFNNVGHSALTQTHNILGYLELHIEQGPLLEAKNLPVGIVTAIAGARRFDIVVTGCAGHAGTVPMNLRRDSLAASCEMALQVEKYALDAGVVATVGKIENRPNGVNVISGKTHFSLDIRSENDALRDATIQALFTQFENIAARRNVTLTHQQTHSAETVQCDPQLQKRLGQAIESVGISAFSLASGAGHDAMAIADICPVSMLFTRCEKGISHHPSEAIFVEDVEMSLKVLEQFILHLDVDD